MATKYQVGIIGVCHVHVHNVATLFQRHPQVELIACADTVPAMEERSTAPYTRTWNQNYLVQQVGIPKAYEDYRQMLAQEQLDLVICNSENSQHADVVEACAEAGAHVCVEKPMAASFADAKRMQRAADKFGIRLLIHWPMPFSPLIRKTKAMLDEGVVGRILEVKMRAAHAGPLAPGVKHPGPDIETTPQTGKEMASTWWYQTSAGGGAMIDFCSYGAILSRWFLGTQAVEVIGLKANLNSQWADVDDNGVVLARFPDALGVFEGSWTTVASGAPSGPIVHGDQATLVVDEFGKTPSVRIMKGQDQLASYEGAALPKGHRNVAEELIHHLETGEPLHPLLDLPINLDTVAILDASARSARSGHRETVLGPGWEIAQG